MLISLARVMSKLVSWKLWKKCIVIKKKSEIYIVRETFEKKYYVEEI